MDESRKQFEEWYRLNWGHTEDNHETLFETGPDDDSYYRLGMRLAYAAWHASRESMKPSGTCVLTVTNSTGEAISISDVTGFEVVEYKGA